MAQHAVYQVCQAPLKWYLVYSCWVGCAINVNWVKVVGKKVFRFPRSLLSFLSFGPSDRLVQRENAKICDYSWALVAHTCNPSYSRDRDQEDRDSKPAQTNSLRDSISKKTLHKHKKEMVEWLKV
jgi:hypothetical protein